MKCANCAYWSKNGLEGLVLNTGWSGKRVLTEDECAGGICTLPDVPVIMHRAEHCPAYRPQGAWWILFLLAAVLCPWLLIWWYSRRATEVLDRLARSRDDALVCRSALHAVWSSLVELFHESGADVRGALSSDDEGNLIGRHNPPEWYRGFHSYAHRVHAKVGLQIKRLVLLRENSRDVAAAIESIDVGRPDVLSEVQ